MKHLGKALTQCTYPKWALDWVEKRLTKQTSEVSYVTTGAQPTANEVKTKGHIVIPYTQGLYESIKKICSRYSIKTNFKGNSTIKNPLVSPKDRSTMANKSGAIYWFQCGDLTYDDAYIGETSRTFEERFIEYLKKPSPIHNHSISTGHPNTQDNFQIIGREAMALPELLKNLFTLGSITQH